MIVPYHNVTDLTMIVIATDTAGAVPKYCSRAEMVPSVTPTPPGIMLTAPARDAKLKINVDNVILIDCPNPRMVKYITRHSKNHANALKNDIANRSPGFINISNVACIVLIFSAYFPILFSSSMIIFPEIVFDLTEMRNPENNNNNTKMMYTPSI